MKSEPLVPDYGDLDTETTETTETAWNRFGALNTLRLH